MQKFVSNVEKYAEIISDQYATSDAAPGGYLLERTISECVMRSLLPLAEAGQFIRLGYAADLRWRENFFDYSLLAES
jgi:hypothetical protein